MKEAAACCVDSHLWGDVVGWLLLFTTLKVQVAGSGARSIQFPPAVFVRHKMWRSGENFKNEQNINFPSWRVPTSDTEAAEEGAGGIELPVLASYMHGGKCPHIYIWNTYVSQRWAFESKVSAVAAVVAATTSLPPDTWRRPHLSSQHSRRRQMPRKCCCCCSMRVSTHQTPIQLSSRGSTGGVGDGEQRQVSAQWTRHFKLARGVTGEGRNRGQGGRGLNYDGGGEGRGWCF